MELMNQLMSHLQKIQPNQKTTSWVVIESFNDPISASLCEFQLEKAGIPFVTLNQRDSSYLSFGQIHVHVQANELEVARKVLTSQHE
jgi:hypothetical protein